MDVRKRFLITIISFLIMLAGLLQADQNDKFKEYSRQLEKIAENKDDKGFEKFIVGLQYLDQIIDKNEEKLKTDWEGKESGSLDDGYAASVGICIGKIIKNNWDKPDRFGLIGIYIVTVGEKLLKNDYLPVAWKLYNNTVKELEKSNGDFKIGAFKSYLGMKEDDLKVIEINKKDKKIDEKQKSALSQLIELGNKILQKNTDSISRKNAELEGKIRSLQNDIAEFKKKDGFWKGLLKFFNSEAGGIVVIAVVFLGLLVTMVLFLFSLLQVKRQLKIKKDFIGNKEVKKDGKAGDTDQSGWKGKRGPRVPFEGDKYGDSEKKKEKENSVNLQEGFKLLAEKIAEIKTWAGETFEFAKKEPKGEIVVIPTGETTFVGDKQLGTNSISEFFGILRDERQGLFDGFKEVITDIFNKSANLREVPQGTVQGGNDATTPAMGEKQFEKLFDSIIDKIADAEREILEEAWEDDRLTLIKQHFENFRKEVESDQFFDQCYELKNQLNFDEDLLYSYKNTVNSLRDYDSKLKKIGNIPKIIDKDQKPAKPGKDLQMVMKNINFLFSLQSPDVASKFINFGVGKWVKEEFWDFADQFFKSYQRKIFKNENVSEMEKARDIIVKILAEFRLQWIPIELGRTIFNSQIHVARSYSEDSQIPDHTISEVVRNGLKEIGGVILLRPEVIVNRLHMMHS